MKFEEYQHNAWGRRVTRDYPKMPKPMQLAFTFNHYISKYSLVFSWLFLGLTFACMVGVVGGSWLAGGGGLISESDWLVPMAVSLFASCVVRWVIPSIMNVFFNCWYRSARPSF